MYQIGLFATGRGQGSRGLLTAIHESVQSGHLPVRVAFVFSNRDPGEFDATDGFFQMVREYGYPLVTHSFRKFRARAGDDPDWRLKYDREVMRLLEGYSPDLCMLAGYLFITGPEMCRRYTMINTHPAAPGGPVGLWQEVIWQLIHSRAGCSGNNIFYVTEELDRGPLVSYCTFSITGPPFDEQWKAIEGRSLDELRATQGEELPLFQLIRQHGMARERPLVVETLRAFALGRVSVREGAVVDGSGRALPGLDLTQEIEELLARDLAS